MNNSKNILLGTILLCTLAITPVFAENGDTSSTEPQLSEFVIFLLNNEYLLENNRLLKLAEESFAAGRYDEAEKYAAEAILYAELSDEYIALQVLMRETNDLIDAAQSLLDWARRTGAPKQDLEIFKQAEAAYYVSLFLRSREEWDEAQQKALEVIALLETPAETEPTDSPAQTGTTDSPARPGMTDSSTQPGATDSSAQPGTTVLPAQIVVRSWRATGDSLSNIAALPEVYGDAHQWRHLYEANRDKLEDPDNPHLIYPGMILDIPSISGEIRSGILER